MVDDGEDLSVDDEVSADEDDGSSLGSFIGDEEDEEEEPVTGGGTYKDELTGRMMPRAEREAFLRRQRDALRQRHQQARGGGKPSGVDRFGSAIYDIELKYCCGPKKARRHG